MSRPGELGDVMGLQLERIGDARELDALFVEPDRMRGGFGRRLVEEAVQMARGRGATRIDVDANPQAVAFYEAVGFTTVGETQTAFWTCTADVAVRRAMKPRFGDRQG